MPTQKTCPRCGRTFICNHEDIAQCQCSRVALTDKARAAVRAQYPDKCLCADCLHDINNCFIKLDKYVVYKSRARATECLHLQFADAKTGNVYSMLK